MGLYEEMSELKSSRKFLLADPKLDADGFGFSIKGMATIDLGY
jgi:hypothetical protein